MANENFFDEIKEQSRVKSAIVQKFFRVWAQIIKPTAKKSHDKIAYIDLFAGPGRYNDGQKSTPVLVLETALQDEDLVRMLVTLFNDANPELAGSLQEAINSIPGIDRMKYAPRIENSEVGEGIVRYFEENSLVPTLFFVDPWGYKGLSLKLVNSVVKDWGCDCIFFFNYNRINMGLGNPLVQRHMAALFGEEEAPKLANELAPLSSDDRELLIVERLSVALKQSSEGERYVLPFRFRNESGSRTSHHLIFVSKHVKGYEVMREIMATESSTQIDGVASFEYNPATSAQPTLFQLTMPLEELGEALMTTFRGRTLYMIDVYNEYHVGRRFIKRNYKAALNQLEGAGRITAEPPHGSRPMRNGERTFADNVKVTFPG